MQIDLTKDEKFLLTHYCFREGDYDQDDSRIDVIIEAVRGIHRQCIGTINYKPLIGLDTDESLLINIYRLFDKENKIHLIRETVDWDNFQVCSHEELENLR